MSFPSEPSSCSCAQARLHSFNTVLDSVLFLEMDAILAGSEFLSKSQEKWMSIYRCKTCASLWVEACYSSGHMEIYYLFPAPSTPDPVQWLHEEAAPIQ